MTRLWKRIAKDNQAATAIEYGLITALIAVVLIGAAGAFGESLLDLLNRLTYTMRSVR